LVSTKLILYKYSVKKYIFKDRIKILALDLLFRYAGPDDYVCIVQHKSMKQEDVNSWMTSIA